VAWITERRDVVSGLFFILAIWAYLRDAEATRAPRRAWYWLSLGCFVLALLAKAITVTLPVVLIVLDVYPLRRLGLAAGGWWTPAVRRRWLEKIPFFLVGVLAAGVAFRVAPSLMSTGKLGLLDRLAISFYGLVFYLWKTLLPVGLAPFYPLKAPVVPLSPRYLVCGVVVLALTVLAIARRRRWPALAAGWIVYVVTLLPVSGIFQNGPQITADRYGYLPSLAIAMIVAAGARTAWLAARSGGRRRTTLVVPGMAVLVLATLGVLTWRQTGIWRDTERLWTHTLAVAPSSEAHRHLGYLRLHQGRLDEMNEHYSQAVALSPDPAEAHLNGGLALRHAGRTGDAIEHYREMLRLAPESGIAHYQWGNAMASTGAFDEAILHYRAAVQADPTLAEALTTWGRVLAGQGKWDEAIARYREALAIRSYSVPHYHWANALVATGAYEEAIQHYREVIRLDPSAAEAYNNWGHALAEQGRWDEAIARYREALRVRPDYAKASANLDRALVQVNRLRTPTP